MGTVMNDLVQILILQNLSAGAALRQERSPRRRARRGGAPPRGARRVGAPRNCDPFKNYNLFNTCNQLNKKLSKKKLSRNTFGPDTVWLCHIYDINY